MAPTLPYREEIKLQGVSFSYDRDDEAVLSGIDVAIPAGSTTALVGPSGSGKSTLADLIMGLLSPQDGVVLVDGVELTEGRARGWRSQVGYVPQDTFLFNDSIRANLQWARPDAEEEQIWVALDQAAMGEVVRALPDGLETPVGDRGGRLSGGERQRLALARALLVEPTLLILDEATSHLDAANIEIIRMALEELPREVSTLVITHRLDTISQADHVIVLDEGRVLAAGGWEELTLTGALDA